MQEIAVFLIILLAFAYVGFKAYKHFFKKDSACNSCSFSPNNLKND